MMKYIILFIVFLYLIFYKKKLEKFNDGAQYKVIGTSDIYINGYNPDVKVLIQKTQDSYDKLNLRTFNNENLKKNLIKDFENNVFFENII